MQTRHLVIITPALIGGGIEKSTPLVIEAVVKLSPILVTWIGINESHFNGVLPRTTVISMGRRSKDGFSETLRTMLRTRKRIRDLTNPIVIVNGEAAELLSALFLCGVPTICVEHSSQPWKMNRVLGILVRTILKWKAVKWVTVNSRQEKIWPSIESFVHIPNPISPSKPNAVDVNLGLIYIGRVVEGKGADIACSAAKSANMEMDVYGDGDLLHELEQVFGDIKNIRFHGYIDEVWTQIGKNRVLLSCSSHEGDGRTIAEAIIRRQPLLLLDTPDHRRFDLPSENYFTDLEDLSRKIEMYRDTTFDALRPSSEMAALEIQKRSTESVGTLWTELIRSSMDG